MRMPVVTFCLAALMFSSLGCGKTEVVNRPDRVPVSGTVVFGGKAVPGATVMFIPQGHSDAAAGLTDAEGKFQLQTFGTNDGAVPGSYKVTIRKVETSAKGAAPRDDAPAGASDEVWLLPKKYGDAKSTDLSASVDKSKENTYHFELKGEPAGKVSSDPAGFKGNG